MLGRFTVSVRKRVLFLCNEPRVTRLVRQALDETGEYLIREEPDREVAAETAQKFQPDIILLDVTGEEINGTDSIGSKSGPTLRSGTRRLSRCKVKTAMPQ